MKGWYTRVITKVKPLIRWLTVDGPWVCIYENKKDTTPLLVFHTSKLTIEEASPDLGLAYAFKIVVGHVCAQRIIIISTPNQFDICEIKENILQEQQNWIKYMEENEPNLPHEFVGEITGKFVYKNSDRLFVTIKETGVEIRQEGKPDSFVQYDSTFDVYTTMETEQDPKWTSVSSKSGSYHIHFSKIDKLKEFVSTALQAFEKANKEEVAEE